MKSKIALVAVSLAIAAFGLLPGIGQASNHEKAASCCAPQAACCAPGAACCEAGVKETTRQETKAAADSCCGADASCCVPGAACCQ